jgi:hypothetical protein
MELAVFDALDLLALLSKLVPGKVPQRTVWPVPIVVLTPSFNLHPRVVEAHELIDVQALI